MHKYLFPLLLVLLCFSYSASAQVVLPQASPAAMVKQTIGLTDITVNYHAPSVKGRKIFGGLVPYGSLWRAGANEATLITLSDDLFLNNERVPAGTYSFFIFPQSDSVWQVVLNKDTGLWGLEGYNELDDVAYMEVRPQDNAFQETMLFYFSDISANKGKLNLVWENKKVSLDIETEVEKKALANINEALAKAAPDDWYIWAQCAEYMLSRKEHHQKALEWINKSISIKDNFFNNWIKAKLYAANNEYQVASALTAKAIKLGTTEQESYKEYARQIETAYNDWKKRR
jgi:O6-methylguanine-DNA--protein-cysteine methyltransferase